MSGVSVEQAGPHDLAAIEALLAANQLPTAGLRESLGTALVARVRPHDRVRRPRGLSVRCAGAIGGGGQRLAGPRYRAPTDQRGPRPRAEPRRRCRLPPDDHGRRLLSEVWFYAGRAGGRAGRCETVDRVQVRLPLERARYARGAQSPFTRYPYPDTRSWRGTLIASKPFANRRCVNAAVFDRRPLGSHERKQAARWIASRQGLPGAYAETFAGFAAEREKGIVVFTGERITSASARHIVEQEACRALRLLSVRDLVVSAALDRACDGLMRCLRAGRTRPAQDESRAVLLREVQRGIVAKSSLGQPE